MFGIGGAELLIILVVALLVLGPEKLPGLARTLGKTMGELRRISTDFQRTLNVEAALNETRPQKKQDKAPDGETASATPGTASETPEPGILTPDAAASDADAGRGAQRDDTGAA